MQEVWKDVIGYEGLYQVSNCGNVRSLDRLVKRSGRPMSLKGKLLPQHKNKYRSGTLSVVLCRDNKIYNAKIHRLVAEAFIPQPDGMESVRHINGDHNNNNVSNLEWYSCTTHGSALKNYKKRERLYGIWQSMKTRCNNPNRKHSHRYVGRGISVCEEWANNYIAFKSWAESNGYADDLSLDRIDNDGNYEPSNCRWATDKEQANNTSRNKFYFYKGEMVSLEKLSEISGLSMTTIYGRLHKGYTAEDAISNREYIRRCGIKKRVNAHSKKYTHNGETRTLREWSEILGIKLGTLKGRIRYGMTGENLFAPLKIKNRV